MTESIRSRSISRLLRSPGMIFGFPLVVCLLNGAVRVQAQSPTDDDTEMRNKALQLYDQGNMTAALPLLEKLVITHPDDRVVLERLGAVLATTSGDLKDPEARKQMLIRARRLFLHARELGDNSDYLRVMLENLPENGERGAFSDNEAVNAAMDEGEAAFHRSDYPGAIAAYQRALEINPKLYAAALYTGDIYFRMNQAESAGKWFARAIEIEPDKETAYRYWGDALMKAGRMEEARLKYIDALIASPYVQATWIGLRQWADKNHSTLTPPKFQSPHSVSKEGDQININIDPSTLGKKNPTDYWLMYPMTRALWQGDKFKQEFPKETAYRHSLREEVDALGTVADQVSEDSKKPKKRKNIDPALLSLLKIRDEGLLESYILISAADQGIAQDYNEYRTAHRDQLRQYISEWVLSPAPPTPDK